MEIDYFRVLFAIVGATQTALTTLYASIPSRANQTEPQTGLLSTYYPTEISLERRPLCFSEGQGCFLLLLIIYGGNLEGFLRRYILRLGLIRLGFLRNQSSQTDDSKARLAIA